MGMKIKICGLTNERDYQEAVRLGADYIGFIFYPLSPRYIHPARAKEIIESVKRRHHLNVGVFVNENQRTVQEIFSSVQLDIVQLHGEEDRGYMEKLGLPYWKALRVRDFTSLKALANFDAPVYLLDTFVEGQYGGTGVAFNPAIVEQAVKQGEERGFSIIVAGGIASEQVEKIQQLAHPPFGLDINSSLEESPGRKNLEKMRKFFFNLKSKSQSE